MLRLHVEAPVTVSCIIDGVDTPVDYTATVDFSLEVTDAVQVGDGWTATALAYKRNAKIEPSPDAAAKGCHDGLADREWRLPPAARPRRRSRRR